MNSLIEPIYRYDQPIAHDRFMVLYVMMDAEHYFKQFQSTEDYLQSQKLEHETMSPHDYQRIVLRSGTLALESALGSLYIDHDVDRIGELSEPPIVSESQSFCNDFVVRQKMARLSSMSAHRSRMNGGQNVDLSPFISYDDSLSSSEKSMIIGGNIKRLNLALIDSSVILLSHAIKDLHHNLLKAHAEHKKINEGAVVAKSLQMHRRLMTEDIKNDIAVVSQYDDYYNAKLIDQKYDFKIRNSATAPAWLKAMQRWDKHSLVNMYADVMLKIDILAALTEWTVDRKLPFIPIAAPANIERGTLLNTEETKLNANILLCSLADSTMIPIQLRRFLPFKYIQDQQNRGIETFSSKDLRTEDVVTKIVNFEGKNRTGRQVIIHRGVVAKAFTEAYSAKSTHKEKRHLKELLQPAFAVFDEMAMRQNIQPKL